MSNRKSYFNRELGQRFGYRKLTVGLCSVVLGSFLLTTNNQQVKADTTNDNSQTEEATTNADSSTQPQAKQASVVKETTPQVASTSASSTNTNASNDTKSASVNDATLNTQAPSTSSNSQTQNVTQINQQLDNVKQNAQQNSTTDTKQVAQMPVQNAMAKSVQNNTQVNNQENNQENNQKNNQKNSTNSVAQNNGSNVQNGVTTGETNTLDVTKNNNMVNTVNLLAYSKVADVQSQNVDGKYTPSFVSKNTDSGINNKLITISTPKDNKIYIHYVDKTGKSIDDLQDTIIDVTKASDNKYSVPNGYNISNNKYDIVTKVVGKRIKVEQNAWDGHDKIYDYPDPNDDIWLGRANSYHYAQYDTDFMKYVSDWGNQMNAYKDLGGVGNPLKVYIKIGDTSGDYENYTATLTDSKTNKQTTRSGQFYIGYNKNYNNQDGTTKILYALAECADCNGANGWSTWMVPSDINQYTFNDESGQIISVNDNHISLVAFKPSNIQNLAFDFIDASDTQNKDAQIGDAVTKTGNVGTDYNFSLVNSDSTQQGDNIIKIPKGYKLATDQSATLSGQYKDDTNPVLIKLVHDISAITPGSTGTTKDVTRKIIIQDETGKQIHEEDQTVHFTRTGTHDNATGTDSWGNWTPNGSDDFASYQLTPEVNYYYYKKTDTNKTGITQVDGVKGVSADATYDPVVVIKASDPQRAIAGEITSGPEINTKIYSRNINITDPDGKTTQVTQTIKFHRDGKENTLTHEITWDPAGWQVVDKGSTGNTGSSFNAVDIPTVGGYTPVVTINGQPHGTTVDKETITPTDDETAPTPENIVVTYGANQRTGSYQFVDDDNKGAVVDKGTFSGTTDRSGTITKIPANYDVVNENETHYTFGRDNTTPNLTIHVKHHINTLTGADADHEVAKRTITITNPDGTKQIYVQQVGLMRTINKDAVNGKITGYGDWNHEKDHDAFTDGNGNPIDSKGFVDGDMGFANQGTIYFSAFSIPNINGYTPKPMDKADNISAVEAITHPIMMSFFYAPNDQTATVTFVDDNDPKNQKILDTIQLQGVTNGHTDLPANELAKFKDYDFVNADDAKGYDFTADLGQTKTILLKHGTSDVDLNNLPNGYTRNDFVRTVTRDITITTPDNKSNNTHQEVTFERGGTLDKVTGKVTFGSWSENGKHEFDAVAAPEVPGYTVKGSAPQMIATPDTTNSTLKIYYTANGQNVSVIYQDAGGNTIKTDRVSGKTGETDKDIKYVAPDNWVISDDQNLPSEYTFKASDNAPIVVKVEHGLSDAITEKVTVTRDVKIDVPNGQPKTVHQEVTFTRQNKKDLVSGDTVHGAWSENGKHTFDKVDAPVIPGYAQNGSAPSIVVTPDSKDLNSKVKITYVAGGKSTNYYFVDDDNNGQKINGSEHAIAGKVDETVSIIIDVPSGYVINPDMQPQTSYTFHADNNPEVAIHLKHQLVDASGDADADTTHTFVRSITVTGIDGKAVNSQQTITFKRSAQKDAVTGKYVYGKWNDNGEGALPEYNVDAIEGYQLIDKSTCKAINKIVAQPVKANDTERTFSVNVGYVAKDGQQTIIYQDKDGKEIGKQTVTGKTGDSVKITPDVPDGWTGDVPSDVTIKGHDDPIKVNVDHVHVTVTPDKPGKAGEIIPGTKSKTFPKGVDTSDLTKDVSRTVTITTPDGKKQTITQTVKFGRTADVDAVTGEVKYNDWKPAGKDDFDPINVPDIKGYTPSVKTIDGVKNVPSDWKDNGKTINITYKASEIHIDPNHPIEEGELIPGTNIKAPKGLGKDDLNKTISRIIEFDMPSGTKKIVQSVKAQRGVTIDLGTMKITYDPWKVVGKDSFDPVAVPQVKGYVSDMDRIAGMDHIDPNKDYSGLDVVVKYSKDNSEKSDDNDNNDGNYGNGSMIGDSGSSNNNGQTTLNNDKTVSENGAKNDDEVAVKRGKSRVKKHTAKKYNAKKHVAKGRHGYGKSERENGYSSGDGAGNGNSYDYANNNSGTTNASYNAEAVAQGHYANEGGLNDGTGNTGNSNGNNGYGADALPQTGAEDNMAVIALGLASVVSAIGLIGGYGKRKED